MIPAALVLAGCMRKIAAPPPTPKPAIEQQVVTRAAEGTRYSEGEGDERKPLWRIEWKSSNLTYGESGDFHGEVSGASGVLFDEGEETSSFTSDSAHMDQKSNLLRLKDNVVIKTSQPPGKVFCDSVVWYPERKVGEAHGNVRFVTEDYTMGPFDTLLFSPKRKAIGTPKLFEERYGEKP